MYQSDRAADSILHKPVDILCGDIGRSLLQQPNATRNLVQAEDVMEIIILCCSGYRDRPRVVMMALTVLWSRSKVKDPSRTLLAQYFRGLGATEVGELAISY